MELYTLLSSLYREPATYTVSKRDSLPLPHYLKNFFHWPTWKYSGLFTDGITPAVFPQSDQLKTSSSLLSGSQLFNPGSHVTSNCGMMFEFPLGLNFTRVNLVLWQLQNASGRVMSRHTHAFCRTEQLSQRGPQESVSSNGFCSHADMAALSQDTKGQRPRGQEEEQVPWCWGCPSYF